MEPAGPFAESGVHSGFIITHMDGKRVNTTAEAARHLTAAEGKVRLKGYEPNGDAASFELQLGNPAN